MARKVTICSLQWGDLPLAKVCETMAGLGYDGLELGLVGPGDPLPGNGLIAETDGPDGPRGVGVLTCFATRSIGAQQTARRFFVDMNHSRMVSRVISLGQI